jgi:hypothetical protein
MCGHSFTPARKDRAPGTPIRWNGRARFSFSAYTNSENALAQQSPADEPLRRGSEQPVERPEPELCCWNGILFGSCECRTHLYK